MKNRNSRELAVCGRNAVDSLIRNHPEQIIRLFFTADTAPRYGDICRRLAAEKKIYRKVEAEELAKICGSSHHSGVAAIIYQPNLNEPGPLEIAHWLRNQGRLLVLDAVSNSHNLGAMVRTAAFLGIGDILLSGDQASTDQLVSTAMYRMAEGGMEAVRLWRIADLASFMDRFGFGTSQAANKGIIFVAADHRAELDVRQLPASLRRSLGDQGGAVAIVLGNEENGISREIRQRCLLGAKVVGSGQVESLNVAQAAAIFMFALLSV